MKKIEAIIRKTKFDEVKEALLAADIEWFSYTDVRGVGKTRKERIYRGVIYNTDIIERIMLTIVVRSKNADRTVEAILASAQTGEVGDGRIFVSEVTESYRIRTGERGDISLYLPEDDKTTVITDLK
jgi:nitrogen regulatory protein P-II 1